MAMPTRNFNQTNLRLPMRIWDLPTRLFHWIIVVLIVTSYVTDRENWMDLHLLSGFTMLAMLLFRVTWGFVGSETARFSQFVRGPIAALRHLAQFPRREPDDQVGHNEAGGLMIVAMLVVLFVQVLTGLCANDDGATEGPLAKYVGKEWSDRISGWHHLNFTLLEILIVGHLCAIIAYAVVKRHDLVRPMFTGKKKLPAATRAPRLVSPIFAVVVLLITGAIAWAVATLI